MRIMPVDFNRFLFKNRSAVLIILDGFLCGLLMAVGAYPISLGSGSFFAFFFKFSNEKLRSHIHALSLIALGIMCILGFKEILDNPGFIGIIFLVITLMSVFGNAVKKKTPFLMQNIAIGIWSLMILLSVLNIFLKIELSNTYIYTIAGVSGFLCGVIGIPPAPLFMLGFTGQTDCIFLAVMAGVILSLPATIIKSIKDMNVKSLDYRVIICFVMGLVIGIFLIVKIPGKFTFFIPILISISSLAFLIITIINTVKTYKIIRGIKFDKKK